MTDFTNFRSGQRDRQDSVERGQWGKRENVEGLGSVMSVRGTGTLDEEVPILNFGYSFNLPENSNAEVVMMSLGGDVNNKFAIPQLPRDKQFQWAEGTGGMQHPTDPDRRVEFNGNETFLRDGKFVLGSAREVTVTVDGSNVSISVAGGANMQFGGPLDITADGIDFKSPTVTHNGVNIGGTHRHSQPADSDGDAEADTSGPI